ncbi:MAG: hypothetical protein HYX86_05355 [Chloroflexi bacterium]|nr:hypothetical protein [Chloroflexota bacterium]
MAQTLPEKRGLVGGGAVILSIVLGILFWILLFYLVFNTDPREEASRLRFLGVLFLALAFTLTPLIHWLEYLTSSPTSYRGHLLRSARRGGLFALFLGLLAWLRMNGTLNWTSGLLLFLALVFTELLTRLRR